MVINKTMLNSIFMGSNKMTPPQTAAMPCCFSAGGFQIVSDSVLEIDENYNLVQGNQLKVINSEGKVIHEGIRGFVLLSKDCHLVRFADKSWWCCNADGTKQQKRALSKRNLTLGKSALMFDERGKLRLGQQSPTYPTLSY